MKQRTLFIIPWAIIAIIGAIIAGSIPIALNASSGIVAGCLFWVGWLSCRARDWIMRKADQLESK